MEFGEVREVVPTTMEQSPAPTLLANAAVTCAAGDFATKRRRMFSKLAGGRCQRLTDPSMHHYYWRPPTVPSCLWSHEEDPFLSLLGLEDTEANVGVRGEDNDTMLSVVL